MGNYVLMFFALFWGGIPTIAIVPQVISGDAPLLALPLVSIFTIIGTILFIVGLKGVLKEKKLKKLAKTGKESIGTFITYELSHTTNHVPYYKIIFTYQNDKGEVLEVKTSGKYRGDEAEYYAQIGKFSIKFDDHDAVITQSIDYRYLQEIQSKRFDQIYNMQKTHYGQIGNHIAPPAPPQKEVFYICDYCGCSQNKPGKCKYCGANVSKKKY